MTQGSAQQKQADRLVGCLRDVSWDDLADPKALQDAQFLKLECDNPAAFINVIVLLRFTSVLVLEHKRELSKQTGKSNMSKRFTMVYWKGEKFWLGKLLEHPEIMTQGETLEELEENMRDAYRMMVMEDVPDDYQTKDIVV